MDSIRQDVRYALRMVGKNPGFTAVAVLALSLGIGANATVFSWLNVVLLNPIPGASEPNRLVALFPTNSAEGLISVSYPDFVDYQERNKTLSGLTVFDSQAVSMISEGKPERIWSLIVSGNYFDVLGVKAALGRTFLPEEDKTPGARPVVVIGHGLWQRRFGGDPAIVGKFLTLNNHPFTVIGVAPKEFQGTITGLAFDAWVPMMMQEQVVPGGNRLVSRGSHWLSAIGRQKTGVDIKQAQAELDTIARQLGKEYPNTNEGMGVALFPLWKSPRTATEILGPVLLMLMGVAGVVLLIACANVANLLLARAAGRRREIAIRLSLGASRKRLVAQLLTESIVLSLLGGAVGILMALWTSGLLATLTPPTDYPLGLQLGVDVRVLGFTLILSLLTGLVFGLAPALQSSRGDLVTALKDEAASIAGSRRKSWLRNSLVVGQVSLSLVLLISAGLFIQSLHKARTFDPGFNPKNVLLASLDLFPNGYKSQDGLRFYRQLSERLERLPGVLSVSLANTVPLGFGGTNSTSMAVEGYEPARDEAVWTFENVVGSNYFRTLEIPLLRGRDFSAQDAENSPGVAIINETLASRYWKDGDPIGKRIRPGSKWLTIVGIARDSKYRDLNETPAPYLFIPVLQSYDSSLTIHLRAAIDPASLGAALQKEVQTLDPNLPIFGMRTLEGHIGASSFQQRMAATLLGVFGSLALLLAAVGIYGVLAYSVSQRTHEIGIRVALGAQPRQILRLVVGQGMVLTLLGVIIGLTTAAGLTRFLARLLFGVSATDPVTFACLSVFLAVVALLACYIPARRATRVDPVVALRYE